MKQAFRALLPPSGRRTAAALACALGLGLTAVAPAFASVLFDGDFETGDTSQWTFEQEGGDPGDDIIVQSQTRIQGDYAGRFTVEPGDHFPASQTTGERAEVLNYGVLFKEGDVRWFGWSVNFASGFPTSDDSGTWNVFTQWHHTGSSCSVPLDFAVRDDGPDSRRSLVLTSRTGTISATSCRLTGREFDLGLLRTDEWIRFEAQVGFSADPTIGFVKVYVNDQLVLPRTSMNTLYPCCRNYMKQGYYRRANAENTATLYIDGTTVGTKRTDVEQRIACEGTCAGWFPYGTEVTLTAAPDAHAVFTSWLVACASESDAVC